MKNKIFILAVLFIIICGVAYGYDNTPSKITLLVKGTTYPSDTILEISISSNTIYPVTFDSIDCGQNLSRYYVIQNNENTTINVSFYWNTSWYSQPEHPYYGFYYGVVNGTVGTLTYPSIQKNQNISIPSGCQFIYEVYYYVDEWFVPVTIENPSIDINFYK